MKTLPVGLQVYSIRDMLEDTPENFKSVMQQVRDYGYSGVELAGTYGLEPEYIRDALDEIGLVPFSAHVPLAEMIEDAEKVASIYKIIGCKYIVVPYLPEEFRPLTPGYEKGIKEMTRIGKVMKDAGMQMLYHNHDFEFVRMPGGSYGFDDIYKQVPPESLASEPDTCWIKVAGENPAAYVEKYKGRAPVIHLKDYIKEGNPKNLYKLIGIETDEVDEDTGVFEFRPVGFGQQVWLPVLSASIKAGAEWVVVEQDEHYDIPSMECARRSRDYLKILGW